MSRLLEVTDLVKEYRASQRLVRAVNGVSFWLDAGEGLGLVGESGSGKSTTARCILRLTPATSGRVVLDGEDVLAASGRRLLRLRRRIQIVFQDPYASLNPRMTVRTLLEEGLIVHGLARGRAEREARVLELVEMVGLDASALPLLPRSFSGGQRQRIAIARALSVQPDILVADEPVSSLDVSIQAQILNLFVDLRERLGLALLLIAHDLAVVRYACDRVAVLSRGEIVEAGPIDDLFQRPAHPHTRALIAATPVADPRTERERRARARIDADSDLAQGR